MSCIKSLPKPNLIDKREALGEHLFNKIVGITHTDDFKNVSKITGILLEEEENTIYRFLSDDGLLKSAVEKVLTSVCYSVEVDNELIDECEPNMDEEKLYNIIHAIDSENCAKLTGMILELGTETVKSLLHDKNKLNKAVDKAKMAIISDNADSTGEVLHTKVEEIHPQFSDKITGMLLELDSKIIQQLIDDDELLQQYVDRAYSAIRSQETA